MSHMGEPRVGATVDAAFIRRAIEFADLNAVRMTMIHLTGDPEIEALPMTAKLDQAGRDMLINKAVAWLEKNAGPRRLPEPPEAELRRLLDLATQEKTPDLEFEARRDLPGFQD